MKRESNFELLRIIAMMMVLLVHCNYFSIGKVTPEDIAAAPFDSFVKAFAEQLCIVCVNVFVLISGWFGIHPSTKSITSLLYQIAFYHILISGIALSVDVTAPANLAASFIFQDPYWFIPAYLILYCISPVLNSFISGSTSRQHLTVLASFLLLEFLFGWAKDASGASFNHGYSAISFVGLYLLAGYLRKEQKWRTKISASKSFILYLLFTLIPVLLYFLTGKQLQALSYCSPFVVAASAFFFLTFQKMKNFSNGFINSLGKSAFAIYLIHQHPYVCNYYQSTMRWAYELLGGALYMAAAIIFAVCFGLACIALDKLRIYTWKLVCKKIPMLNEKNHPNL